MAKVHNVDLKVSGGGQGAAVRNLEQKISRRNLLKQY